jgi:hypothetical protein
MSTGLDPELLVLDPDGYIYPASKLNLPSSKHADYIVYDNAAIEIRTKPFSCHQEVCYNLQTVMHDVSRLKLPADHVISLTPAARLRDEDRSLPSVSAFGCNPALIVEADGTVSRTSPIVDAADTEWRSAGFHMHRQLECPSLVVGLKGNPEYFADTVKCLDAFIGLVDVMMCHKAGWKKESQVRRLLLGYGRPGEFRVRLHPGYQRALSRWVILEYRTMSPWPAVSSLWTWWSTSAMRAVVRCSSLLKPYLPERSEIMQAIDTCDYKEAKRLWKYFISGVLKNLSLEDPLNRTCIARLATAISRGGYTYYTMGLKNSVDAWTLTLNSSHFRNPPAGPIPHYQTAKAFLEKYGPTETPNPQSVVNALWSLNKSPWFPSGTSQLLRRYGKRSMSLTRWLAK